MSENLRIWINGTEWMVVPGTTVAAAALNAGVIAMRTSLAGEPRGTLCGMGICMECRLTIDGVAHARSCQTLCRGDMEIVTR